MKKVLIIQQIIPEYRLDFFNLLRSELAKENIELSIAYGTSSSSYRSGVGISKLTWGHLIESRYIRLGKINLSWQPVNNLIRDKDLIIVGKSNAQLLNYYLIIKRALGKIKIGFWGHGRNLQSEKNSAGNKIAKLFIRSCDWWFAYTDSVKEYLVENRFPSNKISIVENAIDTVALSNQFSSIPQHETNKLKDQLGIHGLNTAIFCGGMYPEKRIDFLLESCFIIKKEISDFHMIFIGSGKDSHAVEQAAAFNKWIHYVGPKRGMDRVKYFKIASVQLMPGLVGLGVIDSFALETPIITTSYKYHSPEIEYLENWKNGIITENTLEDYSKNVIVLLKNEKYLELIDGCRKSAKHYTIENMVDNFKSGIIQCLESA